LVTLVPFGSLWLLLAAGSGGDFVSLWEGTHASGDSGASMPFALLRLGQPRALTAWLGACRA